MYFKKITHMLPDVWILYIPNDSYIDYILFLPHFLFSSILYAYTLTYFIIKGYLIAQDNLT